MDFGQILDKWEQKQNNAANGRELETWLKDNEIIDKYEKEQKKSVSSGHLGERRRRLLRIPPDDILNIHGLSSEQAWLSLDRFFSKAKDLGFEKLRIIHGKGKHSQGEAILGETVRKYIEQCSFAGESGYEKAVAGGSGATWVFLK